jgi:hypothetical protein
MLQLDDLEHIPVRKMNPLFSEYAPDAMASLPLRRATVKRQRGGAIDNQRGRTWIARRLPG